MASEKFEARGVGQFQARASRRNNDRLYWLRLPSNIILESTKSPTDAKGMVSKDYEKKETLSVKLHFYT